ncbi:MAG: M48 family metallopeptidase [Rhizobiaceae bacterium]|nr:M48 family metallopeptidase [Rhizobiaceae bacterium]
MEPTRGTSLRRSLARLLVNGALVASLIVTAVAAANAQSRMPIVRDAEIEALVRDYARPIFKAAGLTRAPVEIVLINDSSFNAFVVGRRMFINTGALMQAETPNEIIGVIAHEAGHIAGGHQDRLREQVARAQTMAIVSMLLGAGAIAAGAATKSGELAQAGGGIVMGGTEVARRGLLSYQRGEEAAADRSAITYLQATKQSAKGMIKTFERFQSALALSGARVDPYQVSHPMPRDRIANLQQLAVSSPYYDKADPEALQQRHDMMRAKIAVFTQGQGAAARLLKRLQGSIAGQYADTMQTYLYGNLASAVKKSDALVKAAPKNPYFQELRGDILMKANRPAQAAEAYRVAVKLDPVKSGVLRVGLGQALLAVGTEQSLRQAVDELSIALEKDKENTTGYRFLAQAYGMLGDVAEADLATAEGHFYSGAYKDAKIFAARAQQRLKTGSPGWVRAQDIINFRPPSKNG